MDLVKIEIRFDNPIIPSLLHIRIKTPSTISRRKTSSKTKRLTSNKSKSRRNTYG